MKHLLSAADLSLAEALAILDTAEAMAQTQSRQMKKLPTLRGRSVVNLFFEDSTRTRISFEAAAKRLSADVINFSARGSSVSKGESLKDTAQTLNAMGIDAVVVRHPASGAPQRLAETDWIDVPVINAGDGTHQHPTQALLDAFTMRRFLTGALDGSPAPAGTTLAGRKVAIVGDILHSRVARSNLHCLGKLGANLWLCGPATLLPREMARTGATLTNDIREAVRNADVVIMLRIQLERQKSAYFPSIREYSLKYGLNKDVFALAKEDAVIMHPGPINRGVEISNDLADCSRSLILDQVNSGVAVRMALLYLLAGGAQ